MSDKETIETLQAQVKSLQTIVENQKEYIESFKRYLSGQQLVGYMVNDGFVSIKALAKAKIRPDPNTDKVYTVYANMQEANQ